MNLTIYNFLEVAREIYAENIAIDGSETSSIQYGELFNRVVRLANSLENLPNEGGSKPKRIGVVLQNGSLFPQVILSAMIAGTAIPLNPNLTEEEYKGLLSIIGLDCILIDEHGNPAIESAAASFDLHTFRISLSDLLEGDPELKINRKTFHNKVSLVLLTSGSTGLPKRVPLTDSNLLTSAMQVAKSINLTADDMALVMWEQFHIGGITDLLLAPLSVGSSIFTTRGFEVALFYELIKKEPISWFQAVPTVLQDILRYSSRKEPHNRPNKLRLIRSVAAPLPQITKEKIETQFGIPVICTYGMTEASPLITSTFLDAKKNKVGSVGVTTGTNIKIINEDGSAAQNYQQGHIGINGPNVFSGYENNNELNEISFKDGYFLTGDLGYFDKDGYLFITGRAKQLINRGGEKISPQEVDEVLIKFPRIQEAAVFSVPHKTLGEDIVAAIVSDTELDIKELRKYCRQYLADFKIPQKFLFLTQLPRVSVGKVDRNALADVYAKNTSNVRIKKKPANALEKLIFQIWIQELFTDELSVDDDFVESGGDSLALTRLLVTTESILKVNLTEEFFILNRTISDQAKALENIGITVSDTLLPSLIKKLQLNEYENNIRIPVDTAIKNFFAQREKCSSTFELNQLLQEVTSYGTKEELLSICRTQEIRVVSRIFNFFRSRSKVNSSVDYAKWLRNIRTELKSKSNAERWMRKTITNDIFLYEKFGNFNQQKKLLIGFTGNLGRLMQPTVRILECLDPDHYDLLVLRDPKKRFFLNGIPDVAFDLDELVDFITNNFVNRENYDQVSVIGTSGGVPAALYFGIKKQMTRVVGVSAPDLDLYPELITTMKKLETSLKTENPHLTLIHGTNERDMRAIEPYRNLIPGIEVLAYADYKTHNILEEARQKRQLRALFRGWINQADNQS